MTPPRRQQHRTESTAVAPKARFRDLAAFALSSIRTRRRKFAFYCVVSVLEIIFFLGMPKVSAVLINSLTKNDVIQFRRCVYVLIVLTCAGTLVRLARSLLRIPIEESIGADIRRSAFHSTLGRQLRYLEEFPQGDIVSRVINDSRGLQDLATGLLAQIVFDSITLIVLAVLLLHMQFWLGLAVVLTGCAPVAFTRFFGDKISAATLLVRTKFAEVMVTAQAWISDPLTLKLYHLEARAGSDFSANNDTLRDAAIAAGAVNTWVSIGGSLFLALPSIVIFAYGGIKVFKGTLSIGDLFAFSTFAGYFNGPTQRIVQGVGITIPSRLPMIDRIRELTGSVEKPLPAASHEGTMRVNAISAREVTFSYDTGFRLFVPSFEARAGEIVGITGPNGSGKTTFLKILAGLYDPDSGCVETRGALSESIANHWRNFAALPQKQTLYPGTIAENVSLFSNRPHADWSPSLKQTQLLEWVERLPDGWDTRIEGGVVARMSGGQMQRIGLARVFYAQAPINIFDEPTSALDADLLPHLDRSFEHLANQRIVIVVTHSSEVLKRCHRVYNMTKANEDGMSWSLEEAT